MGLMYSNAQVARGRAAIRRRKRAQAEAAGVDVTDRCAFAEWDRQQFHELCDDIIEQSRQSKQRNQEPGSRAARRPPRNRGDIQ